MHVSTILARKGRDVVTLGPNATVGQAVTLLAENKIGVLVISTDGRSIRGILSERDIVRAMAEHSAIADLPVSDLMTRDVVTCKPHDTLAELMSLMTERRIRHLPVVEGVRLAGIVSIGDVVKFRLAEIEDEAEALRLYVAQA
jgi:CBS domain-containing protein